VIVSEVTVSSIPVHDAPPSNPAPPFGPEPPAFAPADSGPFDGWRDRFTELRDGPIAGAMLLVAIAVAAGAFWYRSATVAGGATARSARTARGPARARAFAGSTTSTTLGASFVVHVVGAVATPGLYHLPADARVADAIAAAGGPTADAAPDRLNLAARLADGQQIVVPRANDPPSPSSLGTGSGAGAGAIVGPVNLNTATVEQLDALPGIGPALARAIVDHRERHGRFRSTRELRDVRGIGERKFADIRGLVTV
jgi:competence protein ComEA